jgi:hypothetical protein
MSLAKGVLRFLKEFFSFNEYFLHGTVPLSFLKIIIPYPRTDKSRIRWMLEIDEINRSSSSISTGSFQLPDNFDSRMCVTHRCRRRSLW